MRERGPGLSRSLPLRGGIGPHSRGNWSFNIDSAIYFLCRCRGVMSAVGDYTSGVLSRTRGMTGFVRRPTSASAVRVTHTDPCSAAGSARTPPVPATLLMTPSGYGTGSDYVTDSLGPEKERVKKKLVVNDIKKKKNRAFFQTSDMWCKRATANSSGSKNQLSRITVFLS